MNPRRENRIAALQYLYMWDINPPQNFEHDLRLFLDQRGRPPEYYRFAEELTRGAAARAPETDEIIRHYTQNWEFRRIAKIDLAILRLAIFEMLHRPDIPPVVSINEAIDLSKMFSIPEAKRFINGILDQFKQTLQRPLREPAPPE